MVFKVALLNTSHKYFFQILAAISIQLLPLYHGMNMGWLAPTLEYLQRSNDTSVPFTVTVTEVSWIGSLFGLGSLAGNLFFGLALNRLGRKICLYLLPVPYMIAWILVYFSTSSLYLYFARFLVGITGGGNYIVVPIYISEIADPKIRGALSSMAMLFLSVGIFLGNIFSAHLDYYLSPLVILIFPVVYLICLIKFPETPQFLLRSQKLDEARKSFEFYKNYSASKNLNSNSLDYNAEFEQLRHHIMDGDKEMEKLHLDDFVNKDALKAFATCVVLMMVNQFSGSFALFSYMSTIFAESGTSMDPNMCTIIIGVTQIVGIIITLLLVDRCGRKLLMLISSGCMALGLFGFGIYIRYAPEEVKAELYWMPLVIMIFIIMTASFGVLSLVFTIIVEILPKKIRSTATSFCMASMSGMVFAVLKVFPLMISNYGLTLVMYCCGAVVAASFVYFLLFLKETKGKNLDK